MGATTTEVASGHLAMISQEVASLIDAAAKAVNAGTLAAV
jgi:hypothetical protein